MVTTPPGLQLLQVLDEEHQRDRGAESALVPCIHEELGRDLELLSVGARRIGGTLFDLNADEEWEDPPGPIVDERLALVGGILEAAVGVSVPGAIEITEVQGSVRASLKSQRSAPPQPSLDLILRMASIIASSAYDRFDLLIVAADISSADPGRRELLWKMLTVDPKDLALANAATTIVPIVGSRLAPEQDYLRQPPPRYIVRWDRMLKRSTRTHEQAIRGLVNGDRPIVLFLGAGASASSGIPLGNTYRDLALTEIVGQHPEGGAAEAFFDLLHDRDRFLPGETSSRNMFAQELTLERVLRETFADLGFRPRTDSPVIRELIADCQRSLGYIRPGRKALRELATVLAGRVIVMTVNFDRLVEDGMEAPHRVLYAPEHFKVYLGDLQKYILEKSGPVPVLKLHGSIEDPNSIIATIDTTSAGLHDNVRQALNTVLATTEGPLTWVWVGCSMRDQDVNAWLGGLGAEALDEWWVDPLPGASLDQFFARQRAPIWLPRGRRLQDRLFIDSADGFLRELAAHASAQV